MKVILDIGNGFWSFDKQELAKRYRDNDDLIFDFVKNSNAYVEFKSLSFGFFLKLNKEVVYQESFPKDSIVYYSTDQEYLESVKVEDIKADKEYELSVWAVNDGIEYSEIFVFSIPKPKQPGQGWVWNDDGNYWDPPIESAAIGVEIDNQNN